MNVRDHDPCLDRDVARASHRRLRARELTKLDAKSPTINLGVEEPRGYRPSLGGSALATVPRTLSETEMAEIRGGGPRAISPDDDCALTPSICIVDGAYVIDDCSD